MSPMRKRIAQRLVEAQGTAALLTTFNEIDMGAVMELRNQYKDDFHKKHGAKLGFMSFFVKAACDALKFVPQVNAEIRGDMIVNRSYCDIGVAVGSGKGLVVPVLRNAETMSFAGIEAAIADFGARAQAGKITLDELSGGTFTISRRPGRHSSDDVRGADLRPPPRRRSRGRDLLEANQGVHREPGAHADGDLRRPSGGRGRAPDPPGAPAARFRPRGRRLRRAGAVASAGCSLCCRPPSSGTTTP
jgi:hypothetical protein